MHELLLQRLDSISQDSNDLIRQILHDLGDAPPTDDHEDANTKEIALTLTSRLSLNTMKEPDSEMKHLFVKTKRYVLSIMKVQNGKNLLDILVKSVTLQDEQIYKEICKADQEKRIKHNQNFNNRVNVAGGFNSISRSNSNSTTFSNYSNTSGGNESSGDNYLNDISKMTFLDLKKLTLQNILKLESEKKVTRQNNYQDILNSIAVDIRNKHRRRVQRQKELRQLRQTLVNLDEKRAHLDEQIKTYNDHIDVCMQQLSTKKG
jgi:Ras GTPase-activating-like protein IQGAP2/3